MNPFRLVGGNIKNDLKELQQLLQNVINFLPDPVFAIDTAGKVILWNKAIEELTGKAAGEIMGKGNYEHSYCLYGERKPSIINMALDPDFQAAAASCPGCGTIEKDKDNRLHGEAVCLKGFDREACFRVKASPLYSSDGSIFGAIAILHNRSKEKQSEAEIKQLNYYDSLTGLLNRTYLEKELKTLDSENNLPLSIIRAEINGLKIVNETFGYREGDNLIIQGASVIKNTCRVNDAVIYRWNGSGFTIVLSNTDHSTSLDICQEIRDACEECNESPLPLSISCGTATKRVKSDDIQEVINEAEKMMSRDRLLVSKDFRGSIISSLQKLLEEKTEETIEHASRINTYASQIGKELGLSPIDLHELALLAALHDVGKIAIPDTIILKSESLTPDEWEIMKKHSEIGYNMTRSIPELAHIAYKILHHHEWWNGQGYPDGLSGEDIPLLSRIIAVVDAFDVITSGRSYKKSFSREKALEELKKYSGSHFEPRLVNIFIDIQEKENFRTPADLS